MSCLLVHVRLRLQRSATSAVRSWLFTHASRCVLTQGIGVVLPIENKMQTPEALGSRFGVLDLAMTVAMVLYAAVGFYGYLRFGDAVQGSITLNLPCHER